MSETILTAENLKFRYDPEQPVYALDGVSASVKRGEFVAVLGANGCGKSTLAKQFNAILLPEAGTVLVEGMDTADEEQNLRHPPDRGHGVPEPGQPDRCHGGGRGRGLSRWRTWAFRPRRCAAGWTTP